MPKKGTILFTLNWVGIMVQARSHLSTQRWQTIQVDEGWIGYHLEKTELGSYIALSFCSLG